MRQIWITRAGPPEVLAIKDAPDPQPKAGEVRIRVEASGINFADILGRMGLYPDLPPIPVVPGYEVSGRVDAVGPGVEGDWTGRVVIAATQIAKHLGAQVIGTASASKHAQLRTLGVDHLIDYRTEDFETRTRE